MIRRRGLLGMSKGRLPSGYREVEYIESHANAYIDTDWLPSNDIVIETDMEITALNHTSEWKMIHGSRSAIGYEWYVAYNSVNKKFASVVYNRDHSGLLYRNQKTIELNTRHVVKWGPGPSNVVVDGDSVTESWSTALNQFSTYPIRLMAMRDSQIAGENAQRLYAKYYRIEMWDNMNNKHMKLIPAIRISDNKPGMYDTANDVFYTSSGTGEFTVPAERTGYQEVEWIQSQANAYIDTDWIPSNDIVIESDMEITWLSTVSQWVMIHGSRSASGYEWYVALDRINKKFCSVMDNQSYSGMLYRNNKTIELNTRHVVKWGPGPSNVVVDGDASTTTWSSPISNFSSSKIRLMAMNDSLTSGGNAQRCYAKYYHIEMWDEANDKHMNLIPCYRKSDGVVGMYDIANSVFYTSSGAGTFTKGNDI